MARKSKKEAGFGVIEIVVILCIVAAVAFAGWYIWRENKKSSTDGGGTINSFEECTKAGNPVQDSYPEVCVTKDGKRFPNPAQANPSNFSGAGSQGDQTVLKITQWGIEVPLDESNKDMVYRYEKNDTYEAVFFTFKSLQEKDICKTDVGVSLTRKKTENEPPFNIDNPQSFKKLGTYYYYIAYGSEPCYDVNKKEDVEAIEQVAGTEDIKQFVVDSLKDLRITDN